MDAKTGADRVAHLLARAEYCRERARRSSDCEIIAALYELARGFEAEAAVQAAAGRAWKRRLN